MRALDQILPTQISQQSNAVAQLETLQTGNLQHRLNRLRASNRGFSLTELTIMINGQQLAIGDIDVNLTANSPLADALPSLKVSLDDALRQEEKNLEDDLAVADFWPVLNIGIAYRF